MVLAFPEIHMSPLSGKGTLPCLLIVFSLAAIFFGQVSQAAQDKPDVGTRDYSLSDALLLQDLDSFFGRRADRVGPYVDWTYGWASSYAASYSTAARMLMSIWNNPREWQANAIHVIHDGPIRSVTERVLKPEQDARQLSFLIDRQAGSRLFLLEMQVLNTSCVGATEKVCRAALHPKLSAVSSAIMVERQRPAVRASEIAAFSRMLSAKMDAGMDVFHVVRPLTTRMVLLVLRLTELASVVFLISAALRRIYVPDTAVTRIIVTIAVAWSLDYALLAAERSWSRDEFERRVLSGLETQERVVVEAVASRIETIEASFLTFARRIVKENI